jgi:Transposase domain (DUF772)
LEYRNGQKRVRQLTLFPSISRVFPSEAPGSFPCTDKEKGGPRAIGVAGVLDHEGFGSVDVLKVAPP